MTATWIVIGDSIMSRVADGTAKEHALTLIQNERDVIFKNIASPGASLASTDYTGFNSDEIISTINRISGAWGAYDGILIQAGTNDYGRGADANDTAESLRRILNHVKSAGKKALVLDPIWRSGENNPNSAGNVLNIYRYFMFQVSLEFKDVSTFVHRGSTIMGSSAGGANYSKQEVAAWKQLHPNAAGHRLLAAWIKTAAASAGYF